MDRWRKLRRLSAPEWWLLVQAMVLLPLTAVALHLMGLRRWQLVLARLAPVEDAAAASPAEPSFEHARRAARMIAAASRHGLWRANCLEESLVLWWLLRRRAIRAELRIGVRKGASRVEAHAWVELDGLILNDSDDVNRRYPPFDRDIARLGVEPR